MRASSLACLAALTLMAGGAARAYDKAQPPPVSASGAALRPAATPQKLVDLNRASRAELKTLPGIGEQEAKRIIEGRPYKSKTDLVTKQLLELSAYDRVKRQVVVDHRGIASRPKPRVASGAVSAAVASPAPAAAAAGTALRPGSRAGP
jgi:competence protein ComEA